MSLPALGRPRLNSGLSGPLTTFEFSWPLVASSFGLEETTDLNPSTISWTSIAIPVSDQRHERLHHLPLEAENKFYRLRKP